MAEKGEGRSAALTKDAIVEAAARLFAEVGYERTTVRDLAVVVGRHSGSIFHHFKTKEEILVEVIRSGAETAHATLEQALSAARGPDAKLLALLRAHLEALQDPKVAMAAALREQKSLSGEAQEQLVELRDAYEQRFDDVLFEAAEHQLLRINPDPKDVKMFRLFLLGALNWSVEWYHAEGSMGIDALAERFCSFIRTRPVGSGRRPKAAART